ncbi:MAG: glycosyltransferase, partial [Heliobacteriaceae bacterium]|nr:glycosyltransferase [Heliobacteriaceae bacterium]
LGRETGRLTPAGENLWVMEPPVFLPFHAMWRPINRLNQARLVRWLRANLAELGWKQPVLWTYLPGSGDLLSRGPWSAVVYDCVDDHAAFTGLIDPVVVREMEDALTAKADVVFASARALLAARQKVRPDVTLVPNGADVAHFGQALQPLPLFDQNRLFNREAGSFTRICGFVGGIGDWIDLELLAALARSRPDWALVLIGPVETPAPVLADLPNVFFLGRQPYALLPGYVQHFDVCLAPFRLNTLTASVNPVKIYEYLAAGKPVVTTALPEVRGFAPVVAVAAGQADFIRLTGVVVDTDTPVKVQERVALAKAHSWEARLAVMLDRLAGTP